MAQTIINISTPNDGQGDPLRNAFQQVNTMFTELYGQAVFKEAGKGLSSNDFTSLLLTKLNGIEDGAEANVQSDLAQEDASKDDYVKGQEVFFALERKPAQIEIYAGISVFTVPLGYKVDRVLLVRTELWENTEWSQVGDQLTITKTMITGNRIQINFY